MIKHNRRELFGIFSAALGTKKVTKAKPKFEVSPLFKYWHDVTPTYMMSSMIVGPSGPTFTYWKIGQEEDKER